MAYIDKTDNELRQEAAVREAARVRAHHGDLYQAGIIALAITSDRPELLDGAAGDRPMAAGRAQMLCDALATQMRERRRLEDELERRRQAADALQDNLTGAANKMALLASRDPLPEKEL